MLDPTRTGSLATPQTVHACVLVIDAFVDPQTLYGQDAVSFVVPSGQDRAQSVVFAGLGTGQTFTRIG